jgi:hypothetical protein
VKGIVASLGLSATANAAAQHWHGWCERQHSRWFTEHWRVGIIDAPVHTLLAPGPLPPIRWITPREHAGYWADPFGMPGDDTHVYCERFDERSGLGRIERLELHGDTLMPIEQVEQRDAAGAASPIGHGLHASFPHAFELDGQRYAVAETSAARECVLYRIGDDGRWHSPLTLLREFAAADPAIFRWKDRLWLACTDADAGTHDNLCLFHAERIEGPWQPHPGNPVKVDRGGARMAGNFFEHDGVLYRPGQDCRSTYGAAVVLHRVEECSIRGYRETPVRVVAPDPQGLLPHGLHTLSAWGDRTLVDGKRMIINPLALARKLGTRLRSGRSF